VLLVLGLDVDDQRVDTLPQQPLHTGQAELQQAVLILGWGGGGKRERENEIKRERKKINDTFMSFDILLT